MAEPEEVDAFIWHDESGRILAVGHAPPGQLERVEPIAQAHQKVLKIRATKEELQTLHLTHVVELDKGVYRHVKRERA